MVLWRSCVISAGFHFSNIFDPHKVGSTVSSQSSTFASFNIQVNLCPLSLKGASLEHLPSLEGSFPYPDLLKILT
jgi:hypothetical protein